MTHSAYRRAVDMFEKLSEVPVAQACKTPTAISNTVGLPKSSGYRSISALEADGFLRRDENGVYVRGPAAIQTGLSACCSGRIAPIAQPILIQLRQSTLHSAFLAHYNDFTLSIGPHSIGRESLQAKVERSYQFEGFPELAQGQIIETTLRPVESDVARRTGALIAPVSTDPTTILVIGLLLSATRYVAPHMSDALQSACLQLQSAITAD